MTWLSHLRSPTNCITRTLEYRKRQTLETFGKLKRGMLCKRLGFTPHLSPVPSISISLAPLVSFVLRIIYLLILRDCKISLLHAYFCALSTFTFGSSFFRPPFSLSQVTSRCCIKVLGPHANTMRKLLKYVCLRFLFF